MAEGRFSVREAVAEGFDFWRRDGRKAIGPLAVSAAGLVAISVGGDAATLAGGLGLYGLGALMAQGALYRLALDGAEPASRNGPLGFQWRGLETRLLAIILLTLFLLMVVAFVAAFILATLLVGFVGGEAAASAPTPEALLASLSGTGRFIFNAAAVVMVLILVAIGTRLALAAPATAAEGRVRFLSSAGLTRGLVLRILAAMVVINLPVFILQSLAAVFGGLTHNPANGAVAQMIVSVIAVFFYVPISVGMLAHIYRRLTAGAPGLS